MRAPPTTDSWLRRRLTSIGDALSRSAGTILSLLGIFLLAAVSLYVVWPSEPGKWLPPAVPWPEGRGVSIGGFERETIRLGLDLQGGSRLLLQASLPEGAEGFIREHRDAGDGEGGRGTGGAPRDAPTS